MKAKVLFLIMLTACIYADAQKKQIKTTDETNENYYEWITYLNEGEIQWNDNNGVAFRFVITTSEIYDAIYIEKIYIGEEGGGKKILKKRLVNMLNLAELYNLKGEISGIEFIKWDSWNTFEVKILNKTFKFEDIDNDIISVTLK